MSYPMTAIERFWPKVQKSDGCWIWTASVTRQGYGHFKFRGKMDKAHRVSWILHNREIPDGMCVLHECDNPSCVNPGHLFLGSNDDNVADRVRKGRSGSAKGESHGRAKLKQGDVAVIRERLSRGDQQKDIALDYGVSPPCIGYLARGETWNAVQ